MLMCLKEERNQNIFLVLFEIMFFQWAIS